MAPLTAAEIIEHPEFKNLEWNLQPIQKGKVPVAKGRGGPFDIAYEIHGTGPIHLVWIMGLGAFKSAWQRQTKDFGHDKGTQYSCLIFDNRGVCESDKPFLRYSTSEMAKDVIDLLDHLGWTQRRSVHVIGISMGGMISQELGLLIPERIASLSLISTAARIKNTVGFIENLRDRINLFIPKALDDQLIMIKRNLYSEMFLELPDADGNFPTNGDRVAAQEVSKRLDTHALTRKSFILQAIAANWHNKSPAQLKKLGDGIGRERMQVMHGTIDRMITVPHGHVLIEELGGNESGLTSTIFEGRGHVLPIEERKEFSRLIEALVQKAEALNKSSG